MFKIAHRGYSERYPENTLLAFQKAIEAGADMIELDVHLSRDGELVVIHDDDISRTSNGYGLVMDTPLSELKKLDFSYKFPHFGHVSIPALGEVFDLVKGKIMVNVEIKKLPMNYKGIEEKLVELIRVKGVADQVIISSFDHYSLLKVKVLFPEIRTGMLYVAVWTCFERELEALKAYSVHPHVDAAYAEQLKWAHDNGYKVYPWVAGSREELTRLIGSGHVDGIMVNDLELFLK